MASLYSVGTDHTDTAPIGTDEIPWRVDSSPRIRTTCLGDRRSGRIHYHPERQSQRKSARCARSVRHQCGLRACPCLSVPVSAYPCQRCSGPTRHSRNSRKNQQNGSLVLGGGLDASRSRNDSCNSSNSSNSFSNVLMRPGVVDQRGSRATNHSATPTLDRHARLGAPEGSSPRAPPHRAPPPR